MDDRHPRHAESGASRSCRQRRMRPHAERRRPPGLRSRPARDGGDRRALSAPRPPKNPVGSPKPWCASTPGSRSASRRDSTGDHAASTAWSPSCPSSCGSTPVQPPRRHWRRRRRRRRGWRRSHFFFLAAEVTHEQADQASRDRARCGTRGDLAVRRGAVFDVVGSDAAADGPGDRTDNAAAVMHAGRLMFAHPFSATKASTPPAVNLTNRLMTLSLSRLVGSPLPPTKSDSKGRVSSMLLARPRCVNIQNARQRPGRCRAVACPSPRGAYNFVHVAGPSP